MAGQLSGLVAREKCSPKLLPQEPAHEDATASLLSMGEEGEGGVGHLHVAATHRSQPCHLWALGEQSEHARCQVTAGVQPCQHHSLTAGGGRPPREGGLRRRRIKTHQREELIDCNIRLDLVVTEIKIYV